jgi:hypothetical protein
VLRRLYARYSRGFGAAVIAVAALVLAANTGPARAAEDHPFLGTGASSTPVRVAGPHTLPP